VVVRYLVLICHNARIEKRGVKYLENRIYVSYRYGYE